MFVMPFRLELYDAIAFSYLTISGSSEVAVYVSNREQELREMTLKHLR